MREPQQNSGLQDIQLAALFTNEIVKLKGKKKKVAYIFFLRSVIQCNVDY